MATARKALGPLYMTKRGSDGAMVEERMASLSPAGTLKTMTLASFTIFPIFITC